MLKPIKSHRRSDLVFNQIRDLIFRGQLKAGQRLPPERELAQSLGVSRPTLREAIQQLVDQGLVDNHHGVGTFVHKTEPQDDPGPLLKLLGGQAPPLVDYLEVRRALEINGAALAARRAGEADIKLLAGNIKTMRDQVETGRIAIEEDASFHMNIAYATNNMVQIHLMRSFYDLLHYGMNRMFESWYTRPGSDWQAFHKHVEIFQAIGGHDPDRAAQAMKEHIDVLIEMCQEKGL